MKTYLLPFALATLAVSAVAGAQTTPSSSPPSDSATPPSSATQAPSAPSATGSSSYSSGSTDSKAQLKECLAKQKASNPQISDTEAKRACGKMDAPK